MKSLKSKISESHQNQKPEDKQNMETAFYNIIDIYESINMIINNNEIKKEIGIPQGCCFGSGLFVLYIDKILKQIKEKLIVNILSIQMI